MRTLTVHSPHRSLSASSSAAYRAALDGAGHVHTPRPSAPRCGSSTCLVPPTMCRFREGTPFTVPQGTVFVVTALGSVYQAGQEAHLLINGLEELIAAASLKLGKRTGSSKFPRDSLRSPDRLSASQAQVPRAGAGANLAPQ
jgi:hypothetical protein